MPKSRLKQPTLDGLRSAHTLNNATREAHNIPEGVLAGEVAHWKDMEKLVSDYFSNVRNPTRRWSDLYNSVKRSLMNLKDCSSNLKVDLLLARYASKVDSYIADPDVKQNFQDEFKSSLLAHDLAISRDRALAQGRVTGNILSELGAQQLASEAGTMMETPQDDESDVNSDPFSPSDATHVTIVKGNSVYQLQTPSKNVVSPNKPALQTEDVQVLKSIADICINASSRKTCSHDLLQLSNSVISKRREYNSLRALQVFGLANECISLQDRAAIDDSLANIIAGDKADPIISSYIKKTISEFALSSQRVSPYTNDDERTIYIEIGVNKKHLDGIGVMVEEDVSWLLIESSGYGKEQNYVHSIDDCIKNIKNGTDSLKFIMSKYKNASISTMKKVKIYSVQIIQTRMSLICYQLKNGQKWSCHECLDAEMPLQWSKRSLLLPVWEMFAFLHEELIEQGKVHADLLKENLGITNVESDKITSLFDVSL
ncbi:hypothetical protein MAM1_0668d11100 [Mucor ambiguus]|uniref:Uncharacterized protein n=1 Tax=Mucor ambiguus TaxID=91626 RepID=A0A0C9LZ04_9FUNG|nr:hypothetical protein MAM1_0668d11100 [Mucor ambiguus]